MRTLSKLAACAAALAVLAACGEERGSDGLSSDERQKLNKHAEELQNQDVDASPDSLVVSNDEWMQAESGEAATNSPAANGQ